MKVIVVHGDDQFKIQNRIDVFKKTAKNRGWDIEVVDGKKQNFTDEIRNSNLFNPKRLIFLENPQKITNDISSNIINVDDESTLVVYSFKKIPVSTIKLISSNISEEKYEITQNIWNFLDSFYPGNSLNAYKLLESALSKDAAEFIYTMLARRLKDIYLLLKDAENIAMSPWVFKKTQNQAQKFDITLLNELIQYLAYNDMDIKNGKISTRESLDFMIGKYLQ